MTTMTCIYCGRRGVRGFNYVSTASNDPNRAEQAACASKTACEVRQAKALAEHEQRLRREARAFGFTGRG